MAKYALLMMLAGCARACGGPTLELKPCGDFKCGTFFVPEDRSKPQGKKLPLKVVVLPAKTPGATPVFFFSGGPGQAAASNPDNFKDGFGKMDRSSCASGLTAHDGRD